MSFFITEDLRDAASFILGPSSQRRGSAPRYTERALYVFASHFIRLNDGNYVSAVTVNESDR